jgi:hypothetical protein
MANKPFFTRCSAIAYLEFTATGDSVPPCRSQRTILNPPLHRTHSYSHYLSAPIPPRPIIIRLRLGITQHIIRLINLRYLIRRRRLPRSSRRTIRMVLQAHLAIRLLDLIGSRRTRYPKHGVETHGGLGVAAIDWWRATRSSLGARTRAGRVSRLSVLVARLGTG